MAKLSYELRIDVNENYYEKVSGVVGVRPVNYDSGWFYEILFDENGEYYNVINRLLDLLEGKYEELTELNISCDDISIWMTYAYNGQCNMEFEPDTLKRLGENGIALCISCYEAGEDERGYKT